MKYFKKSEFTCGCGCGLAFDSMDKSFIKKLIIARDIAKTSFNITSSIRCEAHNKKVGGSQTSSHLIGKAVDIFCKNSTIRYRILSGLIVAGFCRIGVGSNFIHVDADEVKRQSVIWLYS